MWQAGEALASRDRDFVSYGLRDILVQGERTPDLRAGGFTALASSRPFRGTYRYDPASPRPVAGGRRAGAAGLAQVRQLRS